MINQLKEKLLSFQGWLQKRKKNTIRTNVGFKHAKKVGILYTYQNKQKHLAAIALGKKLKSLGKESSLICFIDKPATDYDFQVPSFSSQDIGLMGEIKDPSLLQFIENQFDYLYYLNPDVPPLLDYLLTCSKAKCRVGVYSQASSPLFEIMLKVATTEQMEDHEKLIDQMLYYTQLI